MSRIDDKDSLKAPRPRQAVRPSARELALAQERLAARRIRDAMPGKIETTRLVLRAPIRGDAPDLATLANNINVAEKLARLPHPYTSRDAIAFIDTFSQRPDERPYAITLNDRLIGVMGLTFQKDGPPELGYWLGEPHWGKGYATEAGKALIEAAAATGRIPEIVARALASNAGSCHVLEKLGFERIGEAIRDCGFNIGQPVVSFRQELRR